MRFFFPFRFLSIPILNIKTLSGDASQYHFTKLAIEMNEFDDEVAPTDSRRRPDQRLMEDGKWEEANRIKNLLEDKQRKARRQAEEEAEAAMNSSMDLDGHTFLHSLILFFLLDKRPDEYCARWFRKVQDASTGSVIHIIKSDEYWQCKSAQDWSRCPTIF